MIRPLAAIPAVLVALALIARADDEAAKAPKPTLEPVSLMVSRKLKDKEPTTSSYTTLSLRLAHPGKYILGLDPASKVSEMKDDKGNSLLGDGAFKPNFYASSSATKDRSAILVTVSTYAGNPAKGSSKVIVKGDIVLRCGLDAKSTEEKDVEFKVHKKDDADTTVGDFALRVTAEKGFGFNAGAVFTLTTEKPGIKAISVKDEDGNSIEAVFSYSSPIFNTKKTTYHYTLSRQVKKGKITITYFNKEEKVTVPVDLSVGVGL